jgi:hypothetical protein
VIACESVEQLLRKLVSHQGFEALRRKLSGCEETLETGAMIEEKRGASGRHAARPSVCVLHAWVIVTRSGYLDPWGE